jgi:hypothetical protein
MSGFLEEDLKNKNKNEVAKVIIRNSSEEGLRG